MTTATPRLRTAVIGTGFVGPHHVDAVRRTGLGDVVILAGTDPDRTRRRAASLAIDAWSVDAATVIADPSLDVIHICTPNATHVELASAALSAGRHVVLEKPIATDPVGAADLVARGDASGRHAMVALTYRGYPMVRRARALIRAGELGPLRIARGGYIQDWLADAEDDNWRVDPRIGGPSRAVADIGTHWLDTVEHVSGRRVEAVMANLATLIPARRGDARRTLPVDVETEDAATILLRFEGGAIGACVVSQVSVGHKNAFTIELDGAARSLSWDQEAPERLVVRSRTEARILTRDPRVADVGPAADTGSGPDGESGWEAGVPSLPAGHPEGWGEALRDLLRPFYAAIVDGLPPARDGMPYPTFEDGARSVRFVAAVLESARRERWVPIV